MPETGSSGTVGGLGRKAQPYPEARICGGLTRVAASFIVRAESCGADALRHEFGTAAF